MHTMSKPTVDMLRRRALVGAMAVIAGVPLARLMPEVRAAATDLPHLSEDDPTASALKYHNDATAAPRIDQYGVAASDQFCHNCRFIQADTGAWRPCQIFPGKMVNADGWCSSWAQQ
jgi:hypothetical protein